jgi:enoyl-CoA hydratase
MAGNDFFEGVRANLVDKDKTPKWQHENIFKVSEEEVQEYFAPIEGKEDLEVDKFVN